MGVGVVAAEESRRVRREQAAIFRLARTMSRVDGRRFCAGVIERPPTAGAGIDVHELLEAACGLASADAIQEAAGLFEAVRLTELDQARRAAIVALLRYRSPFTKRAGDSEGEGP